MLSLTTHHPPDESPQYMYIRLIKTTIKPQSIQDQDNDFREIFPLILGVVLSILNFYGRDGFILGDLNPENPLNTSTVLWVQPPMNVLLS